MQLAVPSLPIKSTLPPGAAKAGDNLSSLLNGGTSAPADSFEELMPSDADDSAPTKSNSPADDRAAAEAAVIFSGWLQAAPTDPATVAIAPDATTPSAPGEETGISDPANPLCGGVTAAGLLAGRVGQPTKETTISTAVQASASFDEAATAADLVNATETAARPDGSASSDQSANVAADATATVSALPLVAEVAAQVVTSANVSRALYGSAKAAAGKATNPLGNGGEKIAPTRSSLANAEKTAPGGLEKNFQITDGSSVEEEGKELGIDVAESVDNMSATLAHRSFTAANDRSVLTAFSAGSASATAEANYTNATADAHRAVDAVLTASERLTNSGSGVNLQFSLGGADLAVRVEMRGGELHATFRTNSPELRAALSTEWQTVAAQDAASPLRMVEPVFAASNSSSTSDYSASANSQQQQQRDSGSRESSSSNGSSFARSFSGNGSEDTSRQSEQRSPRSHSGANQHLHAFA